ncbi:MAG: TIGR03067 domain-containing protein [Planctomycetes bacterium]|nr:TIGR03067 domain-containing protein [Planctomycetota bacterium]
MRLCVALLLMAAVVAVADEPKTGAKDKEALQGLWQAVELEANGKKAPAEAVKAFQVQFKGDQIVFNPASENRKHAFAIDPASKPKAMDLTAGDGPKKGQKLPCAIYKLEGDKLTICLDKEGEAGKRPTEFKTAAGDGFALLTLERVKDKK